MKFILLSIIVLISALVQGQSNLDSLQIEMNEAKKNQDNSSIAKINWHIGDILKKKDPEKALINYQEAAAIYEAQNDLVNYSNILSNIGWVYKQLGNNDQALFNFESALKIFRKENYKKGEAEVLNNIGTLYRNTGDLSKAIKFLTKASEISRDLGNEKIYANNCGNIGNIYVDMGDLKKGYEFLSIALELHEKLGMKKAVGMDYGNIAIIFSDQGSHEKSLEYHLKALAISEELGAKFTQGINNENIAIELSEIAESNQKDIRKRDSVSNMAFSYFKKALDICKEINDLAGIAANTSNLGNFLKSKAQYYRASNRDKHDSLITESLKYIYLSDSLYKAGNRQYSITISQNSIASNYRIMVSGMSIDNPMRSQFIDSVEMHGLESYNIANEIGSSSRKGDALRNLTAIYWLMGDFKKTQSYLSEELQLTIDKLKSSFSFIPEKDKENLIASESDAFMKFYSFVLENHEQDTKLSKQAYNTILFNKGLLLKSSTAMRNFILNSKDSSLIKEYDAWLELKKELDELYSIPEKYRKKNATAIELKADSIESNLVQRSNEFSNFTETLNADWKQIKDQLKNNEAAIEFLRYREFDGSGKNDFNDKFCYAAFIITKTCKEPYVIKLFEESALIQIIDNYGGNNLRYIQDIYGTNKYPKTDLFNLIWKPMQSALKDVHTIYYSPDGLLHKVSFSGIRNDQNILLSSSYELHRKGSTAGINQSESILAKGSEITIFGGINYDDGKEDHQVWSYLNGTKVESEKIEKLLRKRKFNVNLYKEFDATEDQFKKIASSSDVIHVATHGFFYPDPKKVMDQLEVTEENIAFRGGGRGFAMNSYVKNENPMMRSGLVFANANKVWNHDELEGEDGVLTALEVAHIDMRKTKLAVMSACETGLGDIQGTEGVYGLQRAFKMAGCQNIVMSLWQVPDKETSEFMSHFYEEMAKGISISSAFINTQRYFSKKYDPYFWAAFVLL